MAFPSQEKIPLKRPSLGPPDVYPQQSRQREDELSHNNVKHGFSCQSVCVDEYGSALKDVNITPGQLGTHFGALFTKKDEISTLPDNGKKKQAVNKDNFWLVTPGKSKVHVDMWFKELASNKPLHILAKRKVPAYHKKEDVFTILCEHNVPVSRATWFIKMTAAYHATVSDARMKRRQQVDPAVEWTQAITKYMREQLQKIVDHQTSGNTAAAIASTFLTATPSGSSVEAEAALHAWTYCAGLARYMYCEGLLERQEFLSWALELLERTKITTPQSQQQPSAGSSSQGSSAHADDCTTFKMLLVFIYQYVTEISQQYLLARRLAHVSCKKLAQMISPAGLLACSPELPTSASAVAPASAGSAPALGTGSLVGSSAGAQQMPPVPVGPSLQQAADALQDVFEEYSQCAQHRALLLLLCGALVAVLLSCPAALVWIDLAEGKSTVMHPGSPLDLLPCSPSLLPLPSVENVPALRAALVDIENDIARRSQAAEMRWSSEKVQQSMTGCITAKLLRVLEVLDKYNFERADTTAPIDGLYNEVFSVWSVATTGDEASSPDEEPLLFLLCEWATTSRRHGEHRATIVGKLLEKRQTELSSSTAGGDDDTDVEGSVIGRDGTGGGSNHLDSSEAYPYHQMLLHFLDGKAPVLVADEMTDVDLRVSFENLVTLYGELISADVFSHNLYVCSLISRGDLLSCPIIPGASVPSDTPLKPEERDMEVDDITGYQDDMQKTSPEGPGSVRSVRSDFAPNTPASVEPMSVLASTSFSGGLQFAAATPRPAPSLPSRHIQYLEQFPLPPVDDAFSHESSQRMVALYGVGRMRDVARHRVRKAVRELGRMFSKRFSLDVCAPDLSNRSRSGRKEFDGAQLRFRRLTRHDQHAVAKAVLDSLLEAYSSFVARSVTFIPAFENVVLFFDLMESTRNIPAMIGYLVQVVSKVWDVNMRIAEIEASTKVPFYVGKYAELICLYAVAMTRRHFASLLLEPELCGELFDGLVHAIKQVKKADECSSAERVILVFLYELYDASSYLKESSKYNFFNACTKNIQDALLAPVQPAASTPAVLTDFQTAVFENVNLWKFRPDTIFIRQLNENKYSFVCNAVVYICNQTSMDKVNDVAVLCAEYTACSQFCSGLNSEWLTVFKSLCYPTAETRNYYPDVLEQIDVANFSQATHESLAVFVAILVARKIFSIEDFVKHVAAPSLLRGRPQADSTPGNEAGARLTCHLLLRLLKSAPSADPPLGSDPLAVGGGCGLGGGGSFSVDGTSRRWSSIRSSCDLHLLAASHAGVHIGPLVAVLKATLLLGEATATEAKKRKQQSGTADIISSLINGASDEEDDSDVNSLHGGGGSSMLGARSDRSSAAATAQLGLDSVAKRTLGEVCREDWVRERFLKEPGRLLDKELLLDKYLEPHMAWHLVELVCRKASEVPTEPEDTDDSNWQQATITRILQSLDKWSFRVAWLELQLMFTRQPSAGIHNEMSILLDNIARATLDVFQSQSGGSGSDAAPSGIVDNKEGLWLVAPLIARLHTDVQGRVLSSAALVLDNSNKLWLPAAGSGSSTAAGSKSDKEKERSTSLLNHLPFLSLVLTCLKGNDDLREYMLQSLQSQLDKFITCAKEDKLPLDGKQRSLMYEALQLRLSLVGGMFDTLQRTNNLTTEWALLLLDLIAYNVVDPITNCELYYTVLDMLGALVHGTLVSDSGSDRSEDNRKFYQTLIKKMKREIGEQPSSSTSVAHLRQLLPLPKVNHEVIVCEPHGSLFDTKGNKIQGFESINKKHGLQVADKVKIRPWDLWEGFKNPAPLSWTYFGGVRVERKPLRYEEQFRLMLQHSHPPPKEESYYLAPPVQPPLLDDVGPTSEKQEEKVESAEVREETTKKARPPKAAKKRPAVVRQSAVAPYPSGGGSSSSSAASARRSYAMSGAAAAADSLGPVGMPPGLAAASPWYAAAHAGQPQGQPAPGQPQPYYGQAAGPSGQMGAPINRKLYEALQQRRNPAAAAAALPSAAVGSGMPTMSVPGFGGGSAAGVGSYVEGNQKNLLRQHLLHRKAQAIDDAVDYRAHVAAAHQQQHQQQQQAAGQQQAMLQHTAAQAAGYTGYAMGAGGSAQLDRGGAGSGMVVGQGYGGPGAAYQQMNVMSAAGRMQGSGGASATGSGYPTPPPQQQQQQQPLMHAVQYGSNSVGGGTSVGQQLAMQQSLGGYGPLGGAGGPGSLHPPLSATPPSQAGYGMSVGGGGGSGSSQGMHAGAAGLQTPPRLQTQHFPEHRAAAAAAMLQQQQQQVSYGMQQQQLQRQMGGGLHQQQAAAQQQQQHQQHMQQYGGHQPY